MSGARDLLGWVRGIHDDELPISLALVDERERAEDPHTMDGSRLARAAQRQGASRERERAARAVWQERVSHQPRAAHQLRLPNRPRTVR